MVLFVLSKRVRASTLFVLEVATDFFGKSRDVDTDAVYDFAALSIFTILDLEGAGQCVGAIKMKDVSLNPTRWEIDIECVEGKIEMHFHLDDLRQMFGGR